MCKAPFAVMTMMVCDYDRNDKDFFNVVIVKVMFS